MTKFLSTALLAGAAMMATATIADAQMAKPTPKATAAAKTAPKGAMASKSTPMKPMPKPTATTPVIHPSPKPSKPLQMMPAAKASPKAAASGRMVTTKLANGKTVTYNCSLAGNATKKACK